jgi:hypothetical protein
MCFIFFHALAASAAVLCYSLANEFSFHSGMRFFRFKTKMAICMEEISSRVRFNCFDLSTVIIQYSRCQLTCWVHLMQPKIIKQIMRMHFNLKSPLRLLLHHDRAKINYAMFKV